MLKTISKEKHKDHIALDFRIKDSNIFFNLENVHRESAVIIPDTFQKIFICI